MTVTKENLEDFRKTIEFVSKEAPGNPHYDNAYDLLIESYYHVQSEHWQVVNGKPYDARVPFHKSETINLPTDENGWIIPKIPELKAGKWYDHDLGRTPSGPAAFIDPETKVDWYSRDEGKIEGTKIKDIDWTVCKEYRRFDAIDETVPDFGTF